ncbi:uncharacterized protein LOC120440530 [Oreochromis aureus]|uniref:uncharacterized protein LOC120440530 n=1 Tax=Oreochromis aureus TaxID=47969 RepID=UPI0019538641|nr:uncharacterized protein LOC120440530 [Oreochromis aureus]
MKPEFKCWSKKWRKDKVEVEELIEAAGRVEYQDNMKNQHILTINNLKKNDSGGYTFRFQKDHEGWTQSDLPGVFLIVTELRVKMSPSAVVTEGQRVTLTCSTSCPLTDNTNYIWYLNSRPLTPRENQNKHLILDPVSREDAGSYSCAVKTNKDISSAPKTLTVQSITGRTRGVSLNPDPACEDVLAQPQVEDEVHYSKVYIFKNHTDPLFSTIEPLQPRDEQHADYAAVKCRHKTSSDGESVVISAETDDS